MTLGKYFKDILRTCRHFLLLKFEFENFIHGNACKR